jgi:hypothetical protein
MIARRSCFDIGMPHCLHGTSQRGSGDGGHCRGMMKRKTTSFFVAEITLCQRETTVETKF